MLDSLHKLISLYKPYGTVAQWLAQLHLKKMVLGSNQALGIPHNLYVWSCMYV